MNTYHWRFLLAAFCWLSCRMPAPDQATGPVLIAKGQMPDVVADTRGLLHLVYGSGDSIMYTYSQNGGRSFEVPSLLALLPRLTASHTRGPQIAASSNGLIVTACNQRGDIFSYTKDLEGHWSKMQRINDADTTARENLMALAADGLNAFAVWLDLRKGQNCLYGARSADGGRTWSSNQLVYASPDSSVCPCCKPSAVMRGNHIYIMFRNWLGGNRDLYLIHSPDGGKAFGPAQKLGLGSWALDGCPMDGGSLALDSRGNPQTVWKRQDTIYSCSPGQAEKPIGKGRNCTVESQNDANVYGWVENGQIFITGQNGRKTCLGKGQLALVKATSDGHLVCIWQRDHEIFRALLNGKS